MSKLFQPIEVGGKRLSHRVVLAPLSRRRANVAHVHGDLAVEYYSQRGSTPGTLLISESTEVAAKASGSANVPGIWSEEQVKAWRRVTDAVHAKGSFIVCQLRAQGRVSDPSVLAAEDPNFPYVSASDVKLTQRPFPPRPLSISEIQEYIQLFTTAATNAMKAGFDGVEVHAANGYLIDQFLQDVTNRRKDEYGGSIENRCRFGLEVVDAVVKVVGAQKTGIRLSPWETFNVLDSLEMRMEDPKPTFSHLVTKIRDLHPGFGYIHVVEPQVSGIFDREAKPGESNDFLREIWGTRPFISAGGYSRDLAMDIADKTGNLIAFGRFFISNPDLPTRLEKGLELAPYDRKTFYTQTAEGYVDYPFAEASASVEVADDKSVQLNTFSTTLSSAIRVVWNKVGGSA
ncbi:hypothetical protein JAAARDRAFT_197051 [Jaapia argillacea MUCL 33604]|uniref:NADH:flavin oxidoreductase/NADH oxidase N-terminal domain-containing protein n=1 Tax=Jaapia argillacea MUCL 33604 TaxID=933084 RepID=A0A067PRM8_9AGAM|nr:hypothetical protein JAAARDRAFT_197051 [Jaapia argillacea MUCL 33604]